MLERLLSLVRGGGTYRVGDLADRLDVSPELVAAMLESLQRMGYLSAVCDTCADGCKACPLAGVCGTAAHGKLWTLNEVSKRN